MGLSGHASLELQLDLEYQYPDELLAGGKLQFERLRRAADSLRRGTLHTNGKRAVQENYNLPGWVSHHNIDIWRTANPVGLGVGSPTWANWQMSGPWLCAHLYVHYCYSGDREFLRARAYLC